MIKGEKALYVIGLIMFIGVLVGLGFDLTKCYVFCGLWD